ncbi:hypothetical protein [uncultured Brachyspira sp.]|uniref:hypothetical protein n=1 Tax=uncultured Brachyspira sp. TaxID=221953 RepID=UPI002622C565|nr:hypothetical protein [uncultured Brachyspira sp.]
MIRNISLITFLMLFMISCSNVKILDPNERDVEVQYVENGYISQNATPTIQFKLKDFADDFTNIWCLELGSSTSYDLYIKNDLFSINFNRNDYKNIDYILYASYRGIWLTGNFRVTNVSINGSQLTLTFEKQVNGSNTVIIDLGTDLDTIMNSIKTYSYLSDKENYHYKIVILTILIYSSLQANGIIPVY